MNDRMVCSAQQLRKLFVDRECYGVVALFDHTHLPNIDGLPYTTLQGFSLDSQSDVQTPMGFFIDLATELLTAPSFIREVIDRACGGFARPITPGVVVEFTRGENIYRIPDYMHIYGYHNGLTDAQLEPYRLENRNLQ